MHCLRCRRGWQQGCVLALLGSILAYMLSLHKVNKECPESRFACLADDTVVGGPRDSVYDDFGYMREVVEDDTDNVSNLTKVAAMCPSGGTEGIPGAILEAQGGEIHGFPSTQPRLMLGGGGGGSRKRPKNGAYYLGLTAA